MNHKATYTVTRYPNSIYAEKITWDCTCGKRLTLTDGRTVPTMARAKVTFKRHVDTVAAHA